MKFRIILSLLFIVDCQCGYGDETNKQKRLLLGDPQVLNDRLLQLEQQLQNVNAKVSVLENENKELKSRIGGLKSNGGAVYVRWGRKDCPSLNNTQLLYTGIAGGGSFGESGSGVQNLCLPHDPDYAQQGFPTAVEGGKQARIWGAEYQYNHGHVKIDDDAPCAVCMDTAAVTSMMIVGKSSCPGGWRKQYIGNVCANHYAYQSSEYTCVDNDPQFFEGRRANLDGRLFFPAVTVCGSLPCPPYENAKYLACVVCTI